MAMKKGIFRKVALERLSSPEQLDQLMQVTTPKGWIALVVLLVIVVIAIIWGIYGKIPDKVQAQGILIKASGVAEVVPRHSGPLVELSVAVGDRVEKGQIIGSIDQTELQKQIISAEAELAELHRNYGITSSRGHQGSAIAGDYREMMRNVYQQSLGSAQERLQWYGEKIPIQEQLLEQGLIRRQDLVTTQQQYGMTQEEIKKLTAQIDELSVQEFSQDKQREDELRGIGIQINRSERELQLLEEKLAFSTSIVSSFSGRVLEVLAAPGDMVSPQGPLLILDREESQTGPIQLEAIVFASATEGKKVTTGLLAQVAPSTVYKEKFGTLVGRVTEIASYPSTYQGMMRVLRNDMLASQFSKAGASLMMHITLETDSSTFSGYRWSSSSGPPVLINPGTICSAEMIVAEEKPITLVIPMLKEKMGI